MTTRISVRERLAPEITASLFSNYRSSVDALLELIDNSVDSRIAGIGLAVELTLRAGTVQIVTTGGEGMGPQQVERNYLRWGGSGKRGRNLLGQYGQGGKAAAGYLGERLIIEVSRPGDAWSWQLEDREYRDRSRLKTYDLRQLAKKVDEALGYVRIRIDGVDRRVDVKRVSTRVAETYRPLLESGQVHVTINGHLLQAPAIPTVERREFRVRAAGTTLEGWIGATAPGSGIGSGMRCYRLGRLVAGGEWFGYQGPAQSPGLARLVGEVEVPRVPLTMNKTDFDRDDPGWREVEARLHRVMAPLVKRLARDDQPPPPATALRAAEQVRRLLGQALRLIERNELFEGFEPGRQPSLELAPDPAEPDPGQLDLTAASAEPGEEPEPQEADKEEESESPEREPRSPERAADNGERRRRGVGRIELRALGDPSVRSLRMQEEDGVTVIVINTQHPLFLERKGDVWYQLEVAAREIYAPLEGINVDEYEHLVNQVMLLALGLRQRRRSSRKVQMDLLGGVDGSVGTRL